MKKFIYLSGIVSINVITFGGLFKILHWPGANILLILGMLFFALFVLPSAILNSYQAKRKSFTLYMVGFICTFAFVIGALFKIMHWPGAGVLLIITMPLPIILFLPVYYFHQRKSNESNQLNLIGIMLLLVYYSLFSALLSLNVSRNILTTFVSNTNLLAQTKSAFEIKNNAEYLDNRDTLENQKLFSIKNKTAELTRYIHNLKTELIVNVDFINSKIADTISPEFLKNIDNIDLPTMFFIGTPEDIGKGVKASELKLKIENYKMELVEMLNNKDAQERILAILNTSNPKNTEGNQMDTWEVSVFYRTMFIAAIYKLTSIELDVRIAESEAIQSVSKNK